MHMLNWHGRRLLERGTGGRLKSLESRIIKPFRSSCDLYERTFSLGCIS